MKKVDFRAVLEELDKAASAVQILVEAGTKIYSLFADWGFGVCQRHIVVRLCAFFNYILNIK